MTHLKRDEGGNRHFPCKKREYHKKLGFDRSTLFESPKLRLKYLYRLFSSSAKHQKHTYEDTAGEVSMKLVANYTTEGISPASR